MRPAPIDLLASSVEELLIMRKRYIAYMVSGVVVLTGVSFAVLGLIRPNWDGHPLVGLWVGEPPPLGIISPHSLTLNSDGTGRESSGVGNFDCRWEPLAAAHGVVRLRITHTGDSYWAGEPKNVDVELVDPDTIRIHGRIYTRWKQ